MDHAATMRRLYDLISAGEIDGFGELLADDFVEHEETPGLEPTKEGVKQFFHMYKAAFPDLRMGPQDVLVAADKVIARTRATGTHQGEFLGMPATGKRVDVQLIDIFGSATMALPASTGGSSTRSRCCSHSGRSRSSLPRSRGRIRRTSERRSPCVGSALALKGHSCTLGQARGWTSAVSREGAVATMSDKTSDVPRPRCATPTRCTFSPAPHLPRQTQVKVVFARW